MEPSELSKIIRAASEKLDRNVDDSQKADEKTAAEENDLDRQKAQIELERERTHNASLENDLAQRKAYADRIFVLIVAWLICLVTIVTLQGIGNVCGYKFHLDSDVLITFIGGTTVNVIGLFGIVVAYLFKK